MERHQPPVKSKSRLINDLKNRVCAFLDSLVDQKVEDAERDFEHVYGRARELVRHKLEMSGTKSETRDLLGEIVFSRLRRGLRGFLESDDVQDELRCAEWVMGALIGSSALSEFATALDRAVLEAAAPREYSFAGMADFISIEEVLQLLGSGNHVGCLTFEKPDQRVDIYMSMGRIAFLDPHQMIRRMLPGTGPMDYREISESLLKQASASQRNDGTPLFLALDALGGFKDLDLRGAMSELGVEVFHEFLLEPEVVFFSYRRLEALPDFAAEHDLQLSVTGILLHGNKKVDDWSAMRRVFPDCYEPVVPADDMYAKIGELSLGVCEIKLLAHINGSNSPKAISEAMGLPLYETYQHLVRLARADAVIAPGRDVLEQVQMSVEESMQLAFEALDANDDHLQVSSALDKVLGDADVDDFFGIGESPTEDADTPPQVPEVSLGLFGKKSTRRKR